MIDSWFIEIPQCEWWSRRLDSRSSVRRAGRHRGDRVAADRV